MQLPTVDRYAEEVDGPWDVTSAPTSREPGVHAQQQCGALLDQAGQPSVGEFFSAIPRQRFVEFVREFARLLDQGGYHGLRIPAWDLGEHHIA